MHANGVAIRSRPTPGCTDEPGLLWGSAEAESKPHLGVRFGVLASSSSGNCSVLIHGEAPLQRVTLIDAGISPRRTRKTLAAMGLSLDQIDDILFTHFDTDHCHAGWAKALPAHTRLRAHARHRAIALRQGGKFVAERFRFFEDPFEMWGGVRVTPTLQSHDELGSAAFRFDFANGASLGYATDLGRVGGALIDALRAVRVLAIESNYCPRLQIASDRPEYLKRRIMDGSGHISNEQCRDAVRLIGPSETVVLLHLSRECNELELALSYHRGAGYRVMAAHPDEPTELIHFSRT